MIHYEKGEKETVKYEVTIDYEKLREIRKIVSERCTEATKISYKGTYEPIPRLGERITELRREYLWRSYQAPRLISLIDQLMHGNMQVIDELQSPQVVLTNKRKIEIAINSMFPISATTDFEQLETYIREYKEHISLNKSRLQSLEQSEVLSYYPKVLDCVQMEEVKRISNQDFNGVAQFFLEEMQSVLDEIALIKQDLNEEDAEDVSQEQAAGVQKKMGSLS